MIQSQNAEMCSPVVASKHCTFKHSRWLMFPRLWHLSACRLDRQEHLEIQITSAYGKLSCCKRFAPLSQAERTCPSTGMFPASIHGMEWIHHSITRRREEEDLSSCEETWTNCAFFSGRSSTGWRLGMSVWKVACKPKESRNLRLGMGANPTHLSLSLNKGNRKIKEGKREWCLGVLERELRRMKWCPPLISFLSFFLPLFFTALYGSPLPKTFDLNCTGTLITYTTSEPHHLHLHQLSQYHQLCSFSTHTHAARHTSHCFFDGLEGSSSSSNEDNISSSSSHLLSATPMEGAEHL